MPLTPEQRVMRASIAAHARWSKEDPKVNAERGQRGLRAKFEREVRQQFPGLADAEIVRRVESAYREHFKRLAFNSSKARGARKSSLDGGGRDG